MLRSMLAKGWWLNKAIRTDEVLGVTCVVRMCKVRKRKARRRPMAEIGVNPDTSEQ